MSIIKEKIKKWIVNLIRDTYPEIDYEKVKEFINEKLSLYNLNGECYHCKKVIVGYAGGFYRNSEGKLFCSHKCIDDNKA